MADEQKIIIELDALEQVFTELELSHPHTSDTPDIAFLCRLSGKILRPANDVELQVFETNPDLYPFPKVEVDTLDRYELILNFVDTLEDGGLRITLDRILSGRGAMRRFKEFLHLNGNENLRNQWIDFERQHRQLQIVNWLSSIEIEFDWK